MARETAPSFIVCDQCGKKQEIKNHITPGWLELSIDKEPTEDKRYDYDEYDFCTWSCARDFADDKHGKEEWWTT